MEEKYPEHAARWMRDGGEGGCGLHNGHTSLPIYTYRRGAPVFFFGGGERQNKTNQIKENNIEKNRKQNRQTTTGLDATGNVATWSVALYVIVHHVLPYRGDSGVYSSATVATLPLGTTGNRKGK